ncbi:MAG TPA: DUF3857 domain-containing protein [Steroidobacteraceae bacterium]|nr:DUF3857 domain-containing protein [Steroidobacteraceae bacterium]
MTSEPNALRAPAIFLYRQVDRDDGSFTEVDYYRIKILTEEGRKYGDVEIPYEKDSESIGSIEARTIRKDGSVVEFNGSVYDRTLVKTRGVKYAAKTFTLPDVEVGSIVEYRFRRNMPVGYVYDSHWILSDKLFTKRAQFSLVPNPDLVLRWSWPLGLPAGATTPEEKRGRIQLEAHDIPAVPDEEFEPPENEITFRVDFIYSEDQFLDKDATAYWKRYGKAQFRKVDNFTDANRAMQKAVATIVAPGDDPETRARKIYARVQQLRNLSYERARTAQENDRDKIKRNSDVGDVWERGYGTGDDLTWLYLALARAAGLTAEPVQVATRDRLFFRRELMNGSELNTGVVELKLGDKLLYVDPGIVFVPFGLLHWSETGVLGLRLDKEGGQWLNTPVPTSPESRIERKAALQFDEGTLQGKVTVTYWGLEAQVRRQEERLEDPTERKRYLEQELKDQIPTGCDVDLSNSPDWASSDPSLVAEFEVRVPGWAIQAGSRALLPVGLFGNTEKHTFEHATRVLPLYFAFPAETDDDISITLPSQLQAATLPAPQNVASGVVDYTLAVENNGGVLHLKRQLANHTLLVQAKYYGAIHDFYQQVRAGDEEQVILSANAAAKH